MATEIELKFIASEQAIAALPEFLLQWPTTYQGQHNLSNSYYETADYYLRKHRLGLRIRRCGERYEMTLKTEGSVVGGLHQRPEYNVALPQPIPSLALLPNPIWPQNCDLAELQQRLTPLFSTDFVRDAWLIAYNASKIELVLDRGEIKAGALTDAISEIELELKQGKVSDVLAFAQQFSELGGLRLSDRSKAARGYRLSQPPAAAEIRAFPILAVKPKSTVEQALEQAIEAALSHWQYHEELWLAGNHGAGDSVVAAMAIIRQIWTIWGGIIARKATAGLRERLLAVEQLINAADGDGCRVCYQPQYTQAKLALTQWVTDKQWRLLADKKDIDRLNRSFKRFADIMLSRSAKALKAAFAAARIEQAFKDKRQLLQRQIIGFRLLAGAYPVNAVQRYLKPWQDLLTAIVDEQDCDKRKLARLAIEQPVFWLTGP